MTFVDILTVAVLVAIGVRLTSGARFALGRRGRDRVRDIVVGLRPRHFLLAPPVFVLTFIAIVGLLQVPGLDWGWWTALGGIGNPVTGGTERTAGTVLEWLVPTVFLLLLLPALPLFAEAEERIFRLGAERRSAAGRLGKSVQFGLAHALVGIPIGAALALSIGGGYFTWCYLRGYRQGGRGTGLAESTRAHLAYNLEVVALVVLLLLFL